MKSCGIEGFSKREKGRTKSERIQHDERQEAKEEINSDAEPLYSCL